ncbi:MAG: Lin0512 family protein [bacterium]
MLKRYLIELGTGIDQHGQDPTAAAKRAVKDAISRSYLTGIREILGIQDFNRMVVKVKVAVPYADKVKAEEVLAPIPFGNKSLEVVEGGLVAEGMTIPELGDAGPEIIMANAAVTVWVEV